MSKYSAKDDCAAEIATVSCSNGTPHWANGCEQRLAHGRYPIVQWSSVEQQPNNPKPETSAVGNFPSPSPNKKQKPHSQV